MDCCNVEKLKLLSPKICQFPQNTQISLICFVIVFSPASNFQIFVMCLMG